IKILMGLTLMEAAVNLFLVSLGYRNDAVAPIFTHAPENAAMTLPTVQALTLTAIVIGVATSAMMLSFVMIIYRHYGTCNVTKIREMHG
ncbi:cation:proton antiporter, partial [candidate division GN15 bacterium]|nr:cation:proton antiporter [candidate division GN15 bacterium]